MFNLNRRKFLTSSVAASVLFSSRAANAQRKNIPISITGVSAAEVLDIKKYLLDFMGKHHVPGLSLAMAYRGKLKLLACAGYANVENNERVTAQHRFRIASVSKPLTSIILMTLIDQGKIGLDNNIFGTGIFKDQFDITSQPAENQKRLKQMTVKHLLEHTCGGWGNKRNDPMFNRTAIDFNHEELIRWTLQNVPLSRDPGTAYDYSNFGYCLLGRIIENRLRMSYQDALKKHVLQAQNMHHLTFEIGRNSFAERLKNEVTYYGQGEDAYHKVMNVSRMDSHGGWIATPTDLVTLALRVDGFKTPSDILSPNTIKTMTTTSRANGSYAKGWSVNKYNNWWHTGSFNGGSSILARTSDQHCWAMTMNTRSKHDNYSGDLDGLPWKIKNSVKAWGNHDLFT